MIPEEYLILLSSCIHTSTLPKDTKQSLLLKLEEGTFTGIDMDILLTDMQKREKILSEMKNYLQQRKDKNTGK